MTPKTAALRFRIWQYASAREWDVTIAEIAEALGENAKIVAGVAQHAGWNTRLRKIGAQDGEWIRHLWAHASFADHIAREIVEGRIGVEA